MNTETKMQSQEPATSAMTPAKGLLLLMAIMVMITLFLTLCHLMSITEFWASFLFLLYWAGIQHTSLEQWPSSVLGATVGLLMAYLLQQSSVWFGPYGIAIFSGLILVLVYCHLMSWLSIAVNMCTMLFLAVGTIPLIQAGFDFTGALVALFAGVVYFTGFVLIAMIFQKGKHEA